MFSLPNMIPQAKYVGQKAVVGLVTTKPPPLAKMHQEMFFSPDILKALH